MGVRSIGLRILSCTLILGFCGILHAETLYVTADDGQGLATIDPTTGAGTFIGASGTFGTYAAAYDPINGNLYSTYQWSTDSNSLSTFNLTTGAATVVGGPFGNPFMLAMEVANNGTIYGGSWDGGLYQINPTTGAPTLIGAMGFGAVMDFAFDSTGTLYAIDNGGTGNDLYKVDLTTGAGTLVASITGVDGLIMGIMFDSHNTLYATTYTSDSSFYSLDTTTGAATFIGSTGLYFAHGGDFVPSAAVPEPSSWLLGGIGIAGFALVRWKSKPRS